MIECMYVCTFVSPTYLPTQGRVAVGNYRYMKKIIFSPSPDDDDDDDDDDEGAQQEEEEVGWLDRPTASAKDKLEAAGKTVVYVAAGGR